MEFHQALWLLTSVNVISVVTGNQTHNLIPFDSPSSISPFKCLPNFYLYLYVHFPCPVAIIFTQIRSSGLEIVK